jgi:predicted amidophosphoribosyltransferase
VVGEAGCGAIPAEAAKVAIEDVGGRVHRRACAREGGCGTRVCASFPLPVILAPARPGFDADEQSSGIVAFRRAKEGVRASLRRIVDYAQPPRCPGCGIIVAGDHSFCLDYWQALDFLGGPACAVCAEPLELALHPDTRCGACLADPPPFDRLRAGVSYGPIARALALKLKHGGRAGIPRTMARLIARAIGPQEGATLIVPVPLHRGRLWWRGYKESALIARALAERCGGTVAVDLLQRTERTPL